jgi:hypothetical protein
MTSDSDAGLSVDVIRLRVTEQHRRSFISLTQYMSYKLLIPRQSMYICFQHPQVLAQA